MIGARDYHEPSDEVVLVLLRHLDALASQILQGAVDDLDGAFDDELTGVDLGLSLLDEEERLGDLGVVSDLHDLHLLDLDTANFAPVLEQAGHVVADEGRICHQAWLLIA